MKKQRLGSSLLGIPRPPPVVALGILLVDLPHVELVVDHSSSTKLSTFHYTMRNFLCRINIKLFPTPKLRVVLSAGVIPGWRRTVLLVNIGKMVQKKRHAIYRVYLRLWVLRDGQNFTRTR